VSGWDTQDLESIVQKRRMRAGARRRGGRGPATWIALGLVALVVLGGGAYLLFRPHSSGLSSLPDPAVDAPDAGGFQATISGNDTITIGLEVRNQTDVPVTLLSARIVAPTGLTNTAMTIIPVGTENKGFDLTGNLPASKPIELGTGATNGSAIVAARYTVDCKSLLAATNEVDEAIFVTIEVDGEQKEEEITPPVVGDRQWLSASAMRACLNPVPTGSTTDQPLPPQPGGGSAG
jgi:hypothetical protein